MTDLHKDAYAEAVTKFKVLLENLLDVGVECQLTMMAGQFRVVSGPVVMTVGVTAEVPTLMSDDD